MDPIVVTARKMLLGRQTSLARKTSPAAQNLREAREVEAALRRIEEGTYGLCEECGAAIGRLWLRAVPEARLCLGCSARRTS